MSVATATPPPLVYAAMNEAARYARLSERTVRRAVASGALPSHRVGRRVLVRFEDVDRWITSNTGGWAPPAGPAARETGRASAGSSLEARP